ncbi:MAG: DsrE/DsrF/TusD sulfur relay family protein [Candidatus Limnocylindria bacterium]
MKLLFVLNDPPYGTERAYNALRLVLALGKRGGMEIKIFLMADAVGCARAGQQTPDGTYNVERMVRGCVTKKVEVGTCGTCMDARGLADEDLTAGVRRSSMAELADWTVWADKVLVW